MKKTLLVLALSGFASAVQAQDYPYKPIRMVVGFPPGGGTDVVARILTPRMSELLGQPFRKTEDLVDGAARAEVGHIVKPRTTEALRVQPFQFPGINRGGKQGDADVLSVARLDQIRGRRIVIAVRRGLHHYAALDAEPRVQLEQGLFRRVARRRVAAVRRERETRLRAEDVEVRIARAGGELEPGTARVRIEGAHDLRCAAHAGGVLAQSFRNAQAIH